LNFSKEEPFAPFLATKGGKKFWEELKVEPVDQKLRRYKSNWVRY